MGYTETATGFPLPARQEVVGLTVALSDIPVRSIPIAHSNLFVCILSLSQNCQLWRGNNKCGEGRISWGQPRLPPPRERRSRLPALPILGGSPVFFCLHHLTQNDQIRHDDTIGRGVLVLLGQPCHCICTKASRGLSATAQFLAFR